MDPSHLTKVADSLSFFPVTRTLTLYNQVTTSRVQYPGRGSALSQVVLVAEYFALMAFTADVASKILGFMGVLTADQLNSTTSPTMAGIYTLNVFAMYTRVLCHSILLNALDEAYVIGSATMSPDDINNNKDDDDDDDVEANNNETSFSSNSRRTGPTVETVTEDSITLISK